jgi:3-oxoacyl-[acyl-carrier-protein] synthase III
MAAQIYSQILGTGHFIPSQRITNANFSKHNFQDNSGIALDKSNEEIISKFKEITTIDERRYADDDMVTSDLAYLAALECLKLSACDKESLDYIIVAHNFGDIKITNKRSDMVPSLASRVKYKLGIENPNTVAYDIIFGCPGWVQAVIQADYFIKAGSAKRILIIGAEVLSRVSDPRDRDSMLYADGAGAILLESTLSTNPTGILAHHSRSDTLLYSKMLYMASNSSNPDDSIYLKMNGRKLYQYALEYVPQSIQECLNKADKKLSDVSMVLIHQANGKMDEAILKRLYSLNHIKDIPTHIMPMTIDWLGNSSVATIPTLLHLLLNDKIPSYQIKPGDLVVFASVGAGMNINAMVYQF